MVMGMGTSFMIKLEYLKFNLKKNNVFNTILIRKFQFKSKFI